MGVQWLERSPHTNGVAGLIPGTGGAFWNLHALPGCLSLCGLVMNWQLVAGCNFAFTPRQPGWTSAPMLAWMH